MSLPYHERALESAPSGYRSGPYWYECIQLARSYVKTGLPDLALEYYDRANRAFTTIGDSIGIAYADDVAGEIFYTQRLYEKSSAFFLRSVRLFGRVHDYRGGAAALLHLGNNYYMRVMDDSAALCYRSALALCTTLGDSAGMAICYSNLSRIYLEARNTKSAIAYARLALKTIRPGNYITLEAGTYQQLGDIYGELAQYDTAIAYIQKAITAARSGDNKIIVRDCYKSLSELYTMMKQPGKAMPYLLAAYKLKDSIEPAVFSRRLAEMDAKYKSEKKEAEIKSLKQRTLIASLKMQQQRDRLRAQGYLLLVLVAIIITAGVAIYYRNVRRGLLEQLQREKMVKETEERERMRIARDIHDELGSGLSKIRFLADNVKSGAAGGDANPVGQIAETSRGLIDNMRDLVWAMNPENTTLDSLVARIREHTADYLEQFPVHLETDIPVNVPATFISKEVTRNVFMIVREALQNIVKHSAATRVWVRVRTDEGFRLEIGDNGKGFDTNTQRSGNGLGNLGARSRAIGATLHINSAEGSGTVITVVLQQYTAPDARG
jgi:signal transduction histidine kinase